MVRGPTMAVALVLAVFVPGSATAQESEAAQEYMKAHQKMMADMGVKHPGDADKDFVMMMIPHHQGAIDMAKVQLQYGKDPTLRAMATEIIAAQEKEIAEMKKWLSEHASQQ